MIKSNTKPLLNKREVAAMLAVKIWTIDSWVSQRKIPFLKLGGCVRFDPDQISKWLQSKTVSPHQIS